MIWIISGIPALTRPAVWQECSAGGEPPQLDLGPIHLGLWSNGRGRATAGTLFIGLCDEKVMAVLSWRKTSLSKFPFWSIPMLYAGVTGVMRFSGQKGRQAIRGTYAFDKIRLYGATSLQVMRRLRTALFNSARPTGALPTGRPLRREGVVFSDTWRSMT